MIDWFWAWGVAGLGTWCCTLGSGRYRLQLGSPIAIAIAIVVERVGVFAIHGVRRCVYLSLPGGSGDGAGPRGVGGEQGAGLAGHDAPINHPQDCLPCADHLRVRVQEGRGLCFCGVYFFLHVYGYVLPSCCAHALPHARHTVRRTPPSPHPFLSSGPRVYPHWMPMGPTLLWR